MLLFRILLRHMQIPMIVRRFIRKLRRVYTFYLFESCINRFFYDCRIMFERHAPTSLQTAGFIVPNHNKLVKEVRTFWYCNNDSAFRLDEYEITRRDIFIHGGPDQLIKCLECQKHEWLSRIKGKFLFHEHLCADVDSTRELCKRQESDLWTHLHQNFNFALGCDNSLPAPRCLLIAPDQEVGGFLYKNILKRKLDFFLLVLKRQLAVSCQFDVVKLPIDIDWNNYDFVFTFNIGANQYYQRPPVPSVLFCHDFYSPDEKYYQRVLDWLEPDVVLTAYMYEWKKRFRFSKKTKIMPYFYSSSLFFARPKLEKKEIDLLVLGPIDHPLYKPRRELDKQIRNLPLKYSVEYNYLFGVDIVKSEGPCIITDKNNIPRVRALNKWSEYLSRARYAIFGGMGYDMMVAKYFETVASGAISILPNASELERYNLRPFVHYIPLSSVFGHNDKLIFLLENYDQYKYIAENAVHWYQQISDNKLFSDFEGVVRECTDYKYPKRVI